MEEDSWSFGLSTSTRRYQSGLKSQPADFYIDFEDAEEDDDDSTEYPCPFCSNDFDVVGLCYHIEDEHPMEANSGVCPVCSAEIGIDMVEHLVSHHGNTLRSLHRLKLHKHELDPLGLYSKKELEDEQFRLFGAPPVVSSAKMAPDPLLSFICKAPTPDKFETIQPDTSTGQIVDEKGPAKETIEKNIDPSALSDKDQVERSKKCDFVQGLLFSTIFEDSL